MNAKGAPRVCGDDGAGDTLSSGEERGSVQEGRTCERSGVATKPVAGVAGDSAYALPERLVEEVSCQFWLDASLC